VRDRLLTEWVVLALVAEGTTHGFDVAKTLAEDGDLGRIWTVRRPLVYRAVDALLEEQLLADAGTAKGARGPHRRLLRVTPAGRRALTAWLRAPVAHIRDVRTELLLKLALHERAGHDPADLVRRQQATFAPTLEALRRTATRAEGFDGVLARWRLESATAVERFLRSLNEINETDPAPPAARRPPRLRSD